MPTAMVGEVRRFNRNVTARVGALNDRFLGLDRPLGEARLLWEIGAGNGRELRSLRSRLELDSGYLSRLLRSLEAAGLVKVEVHQADRRIRIARLTPQGIKERDLLDERSDDLASSLLEPLSEDEQRELVASMRRVERLLTASALEIRPMDPEHPDATRCIAAYFAELDRRSETGFDPTAGVTAEPHELRPPAGVLLVAYLHGDPVACGALKHHQDAPTELKRMWVADSVRGLGIGRRLLTALEGRAHADGARTVRLDTNHNLTEAIAMYRSAGYAEVAKFSAEPFADHWFEKKLSSDDAR
jgi:DNA-binding MarR family transcriptional regulator/GNAT superfamily N-acetyltransferase